jgi:enediyne polyketide synthase
MADLVDTPVVPMDAAGDSLRGLLLAVGATFVSGAPVRAAYLFEGRPCRSFDLNWTPRFFASPCEQAPVLPTEGRLPAETATTAEGHPPERANLRPTRRDYGGQATAGEESAAGMATTEKSGESVLEMVVELVAARAELPVSAVRAESSLLGDLHLNSISVGQLVAEAGRRLGLPVPVAPLDYARATVGSLAAALEERRATAGLTRVEAIPAGLDRWVRTFEVVWQPRGLEPRAGQ